MVPKNLRRDGQDAEGLAAEYLKTQGYRLLERNYRLRVGEIDIIAQEQGTICFVEVKMRRSSTFGIPFEAVTRPKMRKLIQVANYYLKSKNLSNSRARFDVVAVTPTEEAVHFDLLKNAFWLDDVG